MNGSLTFPPTEVLEKYFGEYSTAMKAYKTKMGLDILYLLPRSRKVLIEDRVRASLIVWDA